jgi:putative ABC transport system ATP-binding protein
MKTLPDSGAAGPAAELVRLCAVDKHYLAGPAAVHALHNINLSVSRGEILAICGASGSGKTSLLNLIGMLEPPSEGRVLVRQLLVSKLSEQARTTLRADMIGFVFQAFSLIPVMTALENVMLPLLLRRGAKGEKLAAAREQAAELLSQVGLGTLAGQYPDGLTPSQRQRVAIARALMTGPQLVVADEPTSRLDSACRRLVMNLFARYQGRHGTAFVIATRDQRQLPLASRTLQLIDGHLAAPAASTGARQPARMRG